MSKESGSIPFLPQRSSPTVSGRASGDLIVRILEIPSNLSNTTKLTHLSGQIADIGDDNTAILRTPKGDIKIQSPHTNSFTRGQEIDVDLPAGHPPRQATLKNAKAEVVVQDRSQQSAALTKNAQQNATQQPPPNNTVQTRQSPSLRQNLSFDDIELLQRSYAAPKATASSSSTQLQAGQNVAASPITSSELAELLTRVASLPTAEETVINSSTFQNIGALKSSFLPLGSTAFDSLLSLVFGAKTSIPTFQSALNNLSGQINLPSGLTAFGTASQIHANGASPNGILSSHNGAFAPSGSAGAQKTFNGVFLGQFNGGHVQFTTQQTSATGLALGGTGQSFLYGLPIGTSLSTSSSILGLSNTTAGTLNALVTGHTDKGQPVVTFQSSGLHNVSTESFVLKKSAPDIQTGSLLKFMPSTLSSITSSAVGGYQSNMLASTQMPVMSNWSDFLALGLWGTFQQLHLNGMKAPIDGSRLSLSRIVPNAASPQNMQSSILLFLAAMKSGDIESFLGKDMFLWLQNQGRGDLLNRLKSELGNLARLNAEPVSGEWRALTFPYYAQGEIEKIRLFYRRNQHDRNSDDENDKQPSTRFVMDIPLDRMGDIQIDGLVKGKRMDIILRTQRVLSAPMQQVMRQKYINALENSTMHGELHFQGSSEQWVHIYSEDQRFGTQI